MEKLHLILVISIATPGMEMRKATVLSANHEKMQREIIQVREQLDAASKLFPQPELVIAALGALQPAFMQVNKGTEPIIRAAKAGDLVVQIELYPPGAQPSVDLVNAVNALPYEAFDGALESAALFDVNIQLSRAALVVAEWQTNAASVDKIYVQYLSKLFEHLSLDEMEEGTGPLIVNFLDLLHAVSGGIQELGTFHLTLGEIALRVKLRTNTTRPTPIENTSRLLH